LVTLLPSALALLTTVAAWLAVAIDGSERLVLAIGLGYVGALAALILELLIAWFTPLANKWTAVFTLVGCTALSGGIGIRVWIAALNTACNGRIDCPLG
jgi:hypothetical protein